MKILKPNIFLFRFFPFPLLFLFSFFFVIPRTPLQSVCQGAQFWELWIYNTALLCDRGCFQFHANDIKFKHFGKHIQKRKLGSHIWSILELIWNQKNKIFTIEDNYYQFEFNILHLISENDNYRVASGSKTIAT